MMKDNQNIKSERYIDNITPKPADMVEVVRCKDCKHYTEGKQYCYIDIPCEADGYCYLGERKEIAKTRLIDAEKLKQHYAWWAGGSREMTMDEAKKDIDVIIDLQPTCDPYKHGHWCSTWDTTVKCSECGWFTGGKYNYCPHCGAKMDEVEGDEAESGR